MRCPILTELPPPPPGKTGWPWTEESTQLPDTMPDGQPWPRVSIVTPSYNQGQFVEQTIRSVLLQGYPNVEYIIIDGGSTDGSVEIIRSYEPWLAYWVSEPDEGQADAINKGLRMARGEIVAWLNSDDIYLPGGVETMAQVMMTSPGCGLAYAGGVRLDELGYIRQVYYPSRLDLRDLLSFRIIPQPTVFIRSSALEQAGPLDPTFHLLLDHDLWIRIALRWPMLYVPRLIAGWRVHSAAKNVSLAAQFGEEARRIARKFCGGSSQESLSPDVPRISLGQALAGAELLDASYQFRDGSVLQGLGCLACSVRLSPRVLGGRWQGVLRAMLLALLPEPLRRMFARLRRTGLRRICYSVGSLPSELVR